MRLRKTKFLAALLAVVMMLSLVTQAFAVEVSNTLQGDTSTATETSQTGGNNTGPSDEELPIEEQFITAGKQLLADWAELTDDEKSDRAAYVMELRDELLETDEDSWDEEVYTVMADLESLSGGTETMWVGGASDRYQKFALFSLTEQPWDYGWNRKIPQSTIDNGAKYIYPRTYSVTYNGAKTYIGYVQMFIKPGAYSLNLTEAGELAGGKWDATVSSGKNYTYTAKSGNPRVEKVTVDTGYGSDWTYINLSNLKLGDVIQVNAYQDYYYLKVGNPMVKIYRDSADVTGKKIDAEKGDTVSLSAMGFLDTDATAAGPITFSSSDTSIATVDNKGTVKILSEGTVNITASWTSTNGYFNASSRITFEVSPPVVTGISVKDYQPTYHWKDSFNRDQGTIVVTMSDGSTKEVALKRANSIAGFDSSNVGKQTITVWYDGCKTNFPVTVAYDPATISVAVDNPNGYAQKKIGAIAVGGDVDYVTLPDGTTQKPDALTDYVFPDNGTYEFTVTGMDGKTNTCTVTVTGIDREAPTLTVNYIGGKLSISTQDNLSGVKTVEYVDETFTESTAAKWISSPKTITDTLTGVADGIYSVVVTDHAGNSRSVDFTVGGETAVKPDFSVYVPSNIVLVVNEDGSVAQAPSDAKIYNGVESLPICVTGLKVTTSQGWELVDYNTEFTDADKDAKKLALSINSVPVPASGSVTIDRNAWTIPADGALDLNLHVEAPDQTEKKTLNNIIKITYDVDWYDASLIPGNQYTVTLQNVSNATIKGTAKTLYTDTYGRIPALPRVTATTGYTFVKWVRTDTNTQVNVGDVINENITIKPVIDIADGYFIVNFTSGENGTINKTSAIVKSGTAFSAIKPTATPNSKYELDGWYNSAGTKVADTYSVTSSQTFTAKFVAKALTLKVTQIGNLPTKSSAQIYWGALGYGNGRYVALADGAGSSESGSNVFAYSSDGVNWTQGTLPATMIYRNVCYGGGKFIAVGKEGKSSYGKTALYSTNGTSWNTCTLPSSADWSDVAYGNGTFVAVGLTSARAFVCAYSTDGINWTLGETTSYIKSTPHITYGGSAFMVYSFTWSSYSVVATITNGQSWYKVNVPTEVNAAIYANNSFVATGGPAGFAYTDSDIARGWKEGSGPAFTSNFLNHLFYLNGYFVALPSGDSDWAMSEDGITWTQMANTFSGCPLSCMSLMTMGDGYILGVGNFREFGGSYGTVCKLELE